MPRASCSVASCTEAARLLRGKHKPIFAPHIDTGDHVVVVNASKVVLTSGKADAQARLPLLRLPGRAQAARPTPSCWPASPRRPIRRSVRGMLPKGPLGRQMLKKLKVYAGPNHPHAAQQPQARLELAHAKAR